LPREWKESLIVPVYKQGHKTDCSNYRDISLLSVTYKILSNVLRQVLLHVQRKLLCIISVDFDAPGKVVIIYSAFIKYLEKSGNTMKQCINYL